MPLNNSKFARNYKWSTINRPVLIDGQEFPSIKEAAKFLKIAHKTLKDYAKLGGYKGHKIEILPKRRTPTSPF